MFPEYTRSPEAKYPTAIEQCYFLLSNLWEITGHLCPDIDHNTLTVAGDSVGGNMAIAMALMAQKRNGSAIQKLLLYYPATNSCFDTPTYRQFANDYYLYRAGMQWFRQQYTTCQADSNQITASTEWINRKTVKMDIAFNHAMFLFLYVGDKPIRMFPSLS